MKLNNKKLYIIIIAISFLLVVSFLIYNRVGLADEAANKISISNIKLSSIKTGSENQDDDIINSFDTITYHFDNIRIKSKDANSQDSYDGRIVTIKASVPDGLKKYVSFDKNKMEQEHTYQINDVVTGSSEQYDITLFVLGAPNNTPISPKFEIQESTNNDPQFVVTLGNNGTNTYYEYSDGNHISQSDFNNNMPTKVESTSTNNLKFELKKSDGGQSATYKGKTGRFLTYVLGVYLEEPIKGSIMPTGNISFDINANGATIEDSWVRPYTNEKVGIINPVKVDLPYSSSLTPGQISKTGINNYNVLFESTKANANGTVLGNKHIIGTYAITIFSERTTSGDITHTLNINNISVDGINIPDLTESIINSEYSSSDYSLESEFYDVNGNKVSQEKGIGSASKGTTLIYKTKFNYNISSSNNGLKEIIKIDSNAFRFVPLNDKDVKITVKDNKLSDSDFEVKFVSGEFKKDNYTLANVNNCPSSVETSDQVMNLYGGPCINAKENIETTYDKISSAKTADNKEVRLTKLIVQTKEGIKLPDDLEITIEVGVRVRNVRDITKTYQATTTITSSDYDSNKIYFFPSESEIKTKDNYKKTTYHDVYPTINSNSPWGDSLKIVNFTARQTITVDNKNQDGTMKTNYNANDTETLVYNISTDISDLNQEVGADDVWYINNLKVEVAIPSSLKYIKDKSLGEPTETKEGSYTILTYTLPYTKPNMKISDIKFKATINTNGNSNDITVRSIAEAVNINVEKDTSYFDVKEGSLTIHVVGTKNIILSQKTENDKTVVEKNEEFSYSLSIHNNTTSNVTDYSILDVLPINNKNGSKYNGTYKVKVTLPDEIKNTAIVKCSTKESIVEEVLDVNNNFQECNATSQEVDATAIRIDKISINSGATIDGIKVSIIPKSNEYENKYVNSFMGASANLAVTKSNKLEVRVVSRNISGRVFSDNNSNGIEDKGDSYIENIPVTLYSIDNSNNLNKVEDTVTDKNGNYKFKNLNLGRYKIRANYNKDVYDLTLRYATEDQTKDSDAIKVEDGVVEIIAKKSDLPSLDGIKVTKDLESISDMNIGLISRKSFGFGIDKFITRVDLTYNGQTEVTNYPNLKLVKKDIRNSLNATSKVYYGIKVENRSTTAGYVKLINENIPTGATFDENDPVNKGWFYTNGQLQNISLANDLMQPGDIRYLTIALNIPRQTEFRSYVNTVTLLDIEKYNPTELVDDSENTSNTYSIGEEINYAGVTWNVINIQNLGDEQILTLLANAISNGKHTRNQSDVYKWSKSDINNYINSSFVESTSLNPSVLKDNIICDDASGLPVGSVGGTLQSQSENKCQSGIYTTSKIRLMNINDLAILAGTSTTSEFLNIGGNFWLMNSVYEQQTHNSYGVVNNSVSSKAYYYDTISHEYKSANADTSMAIRPVITISNKNIIPE